MESHQSRGHTLLSIFRKSLFQAFLPMLEKAALQLKQRDIKQSSVINISSIMASLELSKNLPYYYYDYQCSKVWTFLVFLQYYR